MITGRKTQTGYGSEGLRDGREGSDGVTMDEMTCFDEFDWIIRDEIFPDDGIPSPFGATSAAEGCLIVDNPEDIEESEWTEEREGEGQEEKSDSEGD